MNNISSNILAKVANAIIKECCDSYHLNQEKVRQLKRLVKENYDPKIKIKDSEPEKHNITERHFKCLIKAYKDLTDGVT